MRVVICDKQVSEGYRFVRNDTYTAEEVIRKFTIRFNGRDRINLNALLYLRQNPKESYSEDEIQFIREIRPLRFGAPEDLDKPRKKREAPVKPIPVERIMEGPICDSDLNVDDMAKFCGYSVTFTRRLATELGIPHRRNHRYRQIRFRLSEINDFLEALDCRSDVQQRILDRIRSEENELQNISE